jgi:hypothetical protein
MLGGRSGSCWDNLSSGCEEICRRVLERLKVAEALLDGGEDAKIPLESAAGVLLELIDVNPGIDFDEPLIKILNSIVSASREKDVGNLGNAISSMEDLIGNRHGNWSMYIVR